MSLRDRLAAIDAESKSTLPANDLATMHAATEALRKSGILEGVLKQGAHAPDFILPDDSGAPVNLVELRAAGPVVVSFYRGVWCPYCNEDLKALQETLPAFQAAGASLVAISPQTAANSRKAKRQHNLSFPILSDAGNATANAYGLRFTLDPAVQTLYRGYGVDLPAFNGDESWTLPIPARFVVRADGVIVHAEANPDYTRRPEPEDVLSVLAKLAPKRLTTA
jgi:peroxiredoxin